MRSIKWHRCAAIGLTGTAAAAVVGFSVAGPAGADPAGNTPFVKTVVVADQAGMAPVTDPDLVNPWGVAFGPAASPTPLWTANNGTATSTLYSTSPAPTKIGLTVQTPPAPTGVVFNDTDQFTLPDGTPSRFLFDTLGGQLVAWPAPVTGQPPATVATPVATVDGAVFTGLALAHTPRGPRLYAADATSTVRVYNGRWQQIATLSDPKLPAGLTPYNVAVLNDKVYVSYAPPPPLEATAKVHGAIDVYDLHNKLIKRLVTGRVLDGPWGMAIAPEGWGSFGGALLVGNEDGGQIHAYDPKSGALLGTLRDSKGNSVGYDGLWGIAFGNGVIGTPDDLVIVAGTDEYQHGVVALVRPAS